MKTALVVSFYKSSNIGDLALSNAIDVIVSKCGYNVLRYNFTDGSRVDGSLSSSTKTILPSQHSQSAVKLFKAMLIMAMRNIIGDVNLCLLLSVFSRRFNEKDRLRFVSDLRTADVFVLAGGNMFMDKLPSWPVRLRHYVRMAAKFRKPVYALYVGVGPIKHRATRRIYRDALRYIQKISVRDLLSKTLCDKLVGADKVIESADPVFSLPINRSGFFKSQKCLSKNTCLIGICVLGAICFDDELQHNKYLEALKTLASNIRLKAAYPVVFIAFSTELCDYAAVHRFVAEHLSSSGCKGSVAKVAAMEDLFILYDKLHYLIGGRMHSMILAHKCLLSHIGIVWQDKIRGYATLTENESRVFSLEDMQVGSDQIAAFILSDIYNAKRPAVMANINRRLFHLVQQGCILP